LILSRTIDGGFASSSAWIDSRRPHERPTFVTSTRVLEACSSSSTQAPLLRALALPAMSHAVVDASSTQTAPIPHTGTIIDGIQLRPLIHSRSLASPHFTSSSLTLNQLSRTCFDFSLLRLQSCSCSALKPTDTSHSRQPRSRTVSIPHTTPASRRASTRRSRARSGTTARRPTPPCSPQRSPTRSSTRCAP